MKKLFFILFSMVFVFGSLFSNHAAAKAIKIRVGHELPPFTTPGIGIDTWAKEVNAKTDGRVNVEVFPAGALGKQKNAVELLRADICDAYMVGFGTHRHIFPVCSVTGLYGLGFPDTVEGHMASVKNFQTLLDKYPAMANELKGFKIILNLINPNCILLSTKTGITMPTDLKGLKLGGMGRDLELAKKVGAAGVFCMPYQAYQKLQTGVIDATLLHFLSLGEFKIYEIAKYVYDIPFNQSQLPFFMNESTWNKISAKDQKILKEARFTAQRVATEVSEEGTIKGRQAFLDAGGTIATPTKEERTQWEKVFSFYWEQWVTQNEAAGVKNARKILNDYKAAVNESWK